MNQLMSRHSRRIESLNLVTELSHRWIRELLHRQPAQHQHEQVKERLLGLMSMAIPLLPVLEEENSRSQAENHTMEMLTATSKLICQLATDWERDAKLGQLFVQCGVIEYIFAAVSSLSTNYLLVVILARFIEGLATIASNAHIAIKAVLVQEFGVAEFIERWLLFSTSSSSFSHSALCSSHSALCEVQIQLCRLIGNVCFGTDADGAMAAKLQLSSVSSPSQVPSLLTSVLGSVVNHNNSISAARLSSRAVPLPILLRWVCHAVSSVVYGNAPNPMQDKFGFRCDDDDQQQRDFLSELVKMLRLLFVAVTKEVSEEEATTAKTSNGDADENSNSGKNGEKSVVVAAQFDAFLFHAVEALANLMFRNPKALARVGSDCQVVFDEIAVLLLSRKGESHHHHLLVDMVCFLFSAMNSARVGSSDVAAAVVIKPTVEKMMSDAFVQSQQSRCGKPGGKYERYLIAVMKLFRSDSMLASS